MSDQVAQRGLALTGDGKSRHFQFQILRVKSAWRDEMGDVQCVEWDAKSDALFSYASCDARVPKDHPLRPIRRIVDEALTALSPEFEQLYA
jgi:hypothetical protein